jgi:DNA-binding NtrC family response regulator
VKPVEAEGAAAAERDEGAAGAQPERPATLRAPALAEELLSQPSGLCVRVARGAEVGRFSALCSTPLLVGSAPTCGLCIADRHVSRVHCELLWRDGQCVVRDLSSTNGTFLDGTRVREGVVSFSSHVRIGTTELVLSRVAPHAAAVLAHAETFGQMVGSSAAAQRLFSALRSIAGSALSCLLLGETGTGKELAAQALHEHSPRAGKPFLVVDCASVGAQFIEDKLFGHERGSFTGATSAVPGVFEEARGGTVFLDEIGELPLSLQAKLLGVLERREVTRIGSHTPIKLDVRLIAATHRNPREMAKRGLFRHDLLYRISEFTVRIPSLRERSDDIPAIAEALLRREGMKRSLSADGAEYLQLLAWPGNVRELRNVVRRAAALASGPLLDRALLLSLEESTAQIHVPDAFEQSGSASFPTLPRDSWADLSGERMHPGLSEAPPSSRPAAFPPPMETVTRVKESALPHDFETPLAEATEAFRAAYVKELRRRFGDDLNGAAAHAGVHPKSVSRLFRLYRAY